MQTDGTNTLSLIVGAVQSNSKEASSDRRYSTAARWRACLLSITCYYVTWASCKCSIFDSITTRFGTIPYRSRDRNGNVNYRFGPVNLDLYCVDM